ncbi:MAG: hypothetical protein ACRDPY_11965 [Streptosporangiaceae bacterium]
MYRDPDEPASELYRLLPPHRERSELRQALDAARGTEPDAEPAPGPEPGPVARRWRLPQVDIRAASRRTALWLGGVVTLALAGVLASALWALINH